MDFRGRTSTPGQPNQASPAQPAGFNGASHGSQTKKSDRKSGGLLQVASVVLLFAVALLVIALAFFLAFGGNGQEKAIMKDKYQAVFLNNGQVYFGSIKGIGNKSLDLQDIYYLQTSTGANTSANTQSSTNVSLVKLGCELHGPYDRMLINSDQVIFWENLQDTSQVVKAINNYKSSGSKQSCSQASQSSTQQAPATSTPTGSSSSSTGSSTSTTKP